MNYFEWEGFPSKSKVKNALNEALKIVDRNLIRIGENFTEDGSKNGRYILAPNYRWTSSFLTGVLWIAFELTGEEKYKSLAKKHVVSFKDRLESKYALNHHDLGFLYSLSCVADYKITGNEEAKEIALKAADMLINRFNQKGEFIVAWGTLGKDNKDNGANYFIIDCLYNIPLLYWATEVSGDAKYADIAKKHLDTTVKYIMREDGSTYHKYEFDYETGAPIGGATVQGAFDESCWSRGQAWGVGGFALNYNATEDERNISCFKSVLNYCIDHFPSDYVPFWDFAFKDGDDEPRDSSAAVIILCGIMEMAKYLPEDDKDLPRYKEVAGKIFNSIIDNYAAKFDMDCDGLILRGTGSVPHNMCVDECTVWGDYFYMEAIIRCLKDWKMYW